MNGMQAIVWMGVLTTLVVVHDRIPALGVHLDGVDAAGQAEVEGFEDLGFGVVFLEQLGGIHEVAAMGPAADRGSRQ